MTWMKTVGEAGVLGIAAALFVFALLGIEPSRFTVCMILGNGAVCALATGIFKALRK